MASNYRNQTLNEGNKLQGPTHTPALAWSFVGAEEHVSLSKYNLFSEDVTVLFNYFASTRNKQENIIKFRLLYMELVQSSAKSNKLYFF